MKLQLTKDLNATKNEYRGNVDSIAEDVRSLCLTSGAGQAFVYTEKLSEARTYLNSNMDPDPVGYFFLPAEAEMRECSLAEAAQIIVDTASEQNTKLAQIETLRLQAKINIRAATSNLEVVDAFKAYVSEVRSL